MIYTAYEMIRDCRDGKPEGWNYFVLEYVPIVLRLAGHYFPGESDAGRRLLPQLRESLFQNLEPMPERQFVAALRQAVLAAAPAPDPQPLPDAAAALPLIEKQAYWLTVMRYGPADIARMLRLDPPAVEKLRANLPVPAAAAVPPATADCVSTSALLDFIDGRSPWRIRQDIEHHLSACWHCVDHLCRLHEVCHLLRGARPLAESEAAPWRDLLGIPAPKPSLWQKLRRA